MGNLKNRHCFAIAPLQVLYNLQQFIRIFRPAFNYTKRLSNDKKLPPPSSQGIEILSSINNAIKGYYEVGKAIEKNPSDPNLNCRLEKVGHKEFAAILKSLNDEFGPCEPTLEEGGDPIIFLRKILRSIYRGNVNIIVLLYSHHLSFKDFRVCGRIQLIYSRLN